MLRRGEQSLRILERVLQDLQKQGNEKLTSRKIHSTKQIIGYLTQVEDEEGIQSAAHAAIKLKSPEEPKTTKPSAARRRRRDDDILKSFVRPTELRLKKIFEELGAARRNDLPNAAMVLTRILLELSIDHYANLHELAFAGDRNAEAEQSTLAFYREASQKAWQFQNLSVKL